MCTSGPSGPSDGNHPLRRIVRPWPQTVHASAESTATVSHRGDRHPDRRQQVSSLISSRCCLSSSPPSMSFFTRSLCLLRLLCVCVCGEKKIRCSIVLVRSVGYRVVKLLYHLPGGQHTSRRWKPSPSLSQVTSWRARAPARLHRPASWVIGQGDLTGGRSGWRRCRDETGRHGPSGIHANDRDVPSHDLIER